MGKKNESIVAEDEPQTPSKKDRPSYEELIKVLAPIAKPLAGRKLTKKLYKTVKKAAKKKQLRRGVKDVTKALRKGEKGLVVIAGNISPIDVITHIPVLCEDQEVPYIYIPAREDLGAASQTKRPTSIVLVKKHEEYEENYTACLDEVSGLPLPI
eukprot:m.307488 g.307488  ORF g.307488 m.307488 type:complete len:155 (+) comp42347_c0_seq1:291-755(+)